MGFGSGDSPQDPELADRKEEKESRKEVSKDEKEGEGREGALVKI
jgi:hypothetical protein